MKKCPVCEIKYLDEVQYCPKCKAQLVQHAKPESQGNKKGFFADDTPVNKKGLLITLGGTFLFMVAIYLIIWFLYNN